MRPITVLTGVAQSDNSNVVYLEYGRTQRLSSQKHLSLLKNRVRVRSKFCKEFCLIVFDIFSNLRSLIAFDPGGAPTSSDFGPWPPGGIAQRRSTVVAIELGAA